MTLYDVFDRLELTFVGAVIRDSAWLFPVIESVHLLGLALLGGSILIVDLRLMGFGLARESTAYVLEQARPWFLSALATMAMTGIPLLLSEALKCYFRPAFWVKMGALGLALLFTFGVRNRFIRARPQARRWQSAAVAFCSLAVWLTVAAAGRWIGFS